MDDPLDTGIHIFTLNNYPYNSKFKFLIGFSMYLAHVVKYSCSPRTGCLVTNRSWITEVYCYLARHTTVAPRPRASAATIIPHCDDATRRRLVNNSVQSLRLCRSSARVNYLLHEHHYCCSNVSKPTLTNIISKIFAFLNYQRTVRLPMSYTHIHNNK